MAKSSLKPSNNQNSKKVIDPVNEIKAETKCTKNPFFAVYSLIKLELIGITA